MSAVIDSIREKYPQYADVPDEELALRIGEKYPVYREKDQAFAKEFESARFNRSASSQVTPVLPGQAQMAAPAFAPDAMELGQPPTQVEQIKAGLATPEQQEITRTLQQPNVTIPTPLADAAVKGMLEQVPLLKDTLPFMPKVTKGLSDAARENLEGMTSLEGLATLPYMGLAGAEGAALRGVGMGGKAIGAAFTGVSAEQTVDAAGRLVDALKKGDVQEIAKTAGQTLTAAAMTGAGGTVLRGRAVEWIPESRQTKTPPAAKPSAPPILSEPPIIPENTQAFLDGVKTTDAAKPGMGAWLKGLAGESLPRITSVNQQAGEAGVRWASSHVAAPYAARAFHEHVLQGGIDPVRFGAALTEDNLRDIRRRFQDAGDEDKASAVGSLIGTKGSPFATEEAYQAYLARPDVQAAIKRHQQLWETQIDPMYKEAALIDPDVELPTRGEQTKARVNLYVPAPEGEATPGAVATSQPRLTATFQRKSPFAREAKGTGNYGVDYRDMMANTYARQLDIANQNAFNKALVEAGDAQFGRAGQRPTIKGEPTVAFPLKRTRFISENGAFTKAENIYVRASLAKEYLQVADPFGSERTGSKLLGAINNRLNRAALAGLTDFTVHMSNLATVLFTRPASGNIMADILLSAMGRADIPVTITKALVKGFSNNTKQLAELAEIGAVRSGKSNWWTGKAIEWADKTVRLTLDDTYKELAKRGLVESSETARREFVNQAGQYNKKLQGTLTRTLRDTGLSPFITAGRTFNTLGVRNMLMDPGLRGGSPLTRASVMSKWVGTVGMLGTLNYLLTVNQGGGVFGRPGVPLGRLDTGMADEDGKPLTLPFLDLIGFGRGLRVSGVRAGVDATRSGLSIQDAFDSALRDMVNSAIAPIAGPPIRFAVGAASGQATGFYLPRQFPVVPPDENQHFSDFAHALGEANPILGSFIDLNRAGGSVSAALARQLPRFTLQPSKPPEMMENYGEIVHKAQVATFTDDLIHRARRMASSERTKYVEDELAKLPDEDRENVERNLRYRKVEW